jgi:hypothetical protein
MFVRCERDLRLRSRLRPYRAGTHPCAIPTSTIPLGKSASCSGTQNLDPHSTILREVTLVQGGRGSGNISGDRLLGQHLHWQSLEGAQTHNGPPNWRASRENLLEFRVCVRANFAVQIDLFVLGGRPFHGPLLMKSRIFANATKNNTHICEREEYALSVSSAAKPISSNNPQRGE